MSKLTIEKRFFDFYSMIELYMRIGGFRDMGYSSYPVFVSHAIESRIREKYEDVVTSFYEEVRTALIQSIRSELRHFPNHVYGGLPEIYEAFEAERITKKQISSAQRRPDKFPETAHAIFSIPKWYLSYGGKKWAKGTKMLMDIVNVRTLEDKIFWVDKVLDLYHNCGHMLNKTKFRVLEQKNKEILTIQSNGKRRKRWSNSLNVRAKARSVIEFLPYNSVEVQRLVIPRKNLLTFS